MNVDEGRDPEREMADGLARALEQAFTPGAAGLGLESARDVAQIMGLDALDRALAAFGPHVGRPLPAELVPLRDRLLRMAARARAAGRDAPFRDEAGELDALSDEIAAIEWTPIEARDPRATLSALDALEDVRLPESALESVGRVRLTLRVAAALRATLDWLDPGAGRGRIAGVSTEGAVLEVTLPAVEPAGIEAAGDVLGSVGGALVPVGGGAWGIRVPCVAARATYLVLVQGGRTLALPWPSVVRVQMMPAAQIESRSAELGIPLTVPLAVAPRPARELPVVTVALGLKRAWLVADRLIWHLAADAGAADAPGQPGRVRTDDGTECELVDLAPMLAPLPGPRIPAAVSVPAVPAAPPSPPVPPPVVTSREAVAPSMPPPAAAHRPRTLSGEHVRPVEGAPRALSAAQVHPLPSPAAPARAAAAPAAPVEPERAPAHPGDEFLGSLATAFGRLRSDAPAAGTRPAPRALVAEDSLVARVFLSRLLEAEGFEVHLADRAAAMWELLAEGEWSLLCVDVELPDARGEALLHEAARRLAAHRDADLVALVRDEEDEEAAARAGVEHVFRKPFDRAAVARLAARRRPSPGNLS